MPGRCSWNELYLRAIAKVDRPRAEVDSVPVPDMWGLLPAPEWEAKAFLQPHLARARRWLDIGCGTGSVLAAFLRRHPHATAMGIDVSDVAIAHGLEQLAGADDLKNRLILSSDNIRQERLAAAGPFDFVLTLFSLQCVRVSEFFEIVWLINDRILARPGTFAGTVRSTSRSVPTSYVAVADEPNTYISGEPHEKNMIYHHYSEDEIHHAARLLGGAAVHLTEIYSTRDYDPAPKRAWWNFVIVRP
jgi:SAM-dependent methyltransferase